MMCGESVTRSLLAPNSPWHFTQPANILYVPHSRCHATWAMAHDLPVVYKLGSSGVYIGRDDFAEGMRCGVSVLLWVQHSPH